MTLLGRVEEFDQLRDHALGWRGLLDGLRYQLEALPLEVRVQQVKEKFGGLCCYHDTPTSADEREVRRVNELIDAAETVSLMLCYLCGAGATHQGSGHWVRYFCDEHNTEDLYVALQRPDLVEMLERNPNATAFPGRALQPRDPASEE